MKKSASDHFLKVAVAIPCYNCRDQIPRVLKRFSPELRSRISKIWIIDNQSTDGTPEAARQAIKDFGLESLAEVKINRSNFGLGGTHKVAFLLAEKENFDYLAITHGDDQGRSEELKNFLELRDAHPDYAAYLGARFMRGSRLEGYSPLRIAGNIGLSFLYTLLSQRVTYDIGGGMNLFRLKDLNDKSYLNFSDGFTFNMDLLLHYYRLRAKVKFVPMTWTETDQVSSAKTFATGWLALKTLLRWKVHQPEKLNRMASDYL